VKLLSQNGLKHLSLSWNQGRLLLLYWLRTDRRTYIWYYDELLINWYIECGCWEECIQVRLWYKFGKCKWSGWSQIWNNCSLWCAALSNYTGKLLISGLLHDLLPFVPLSRQETLYHCHQRWVQNSIIDNVTASIRLCSLFPKYREF